MKKIEGFSKSVRSLLSGSRFAIDYYQREYRWEKKQIVELIEDLSEKFLESHEPGNERSAVEGYGHYFLGSIIISEKDARKYIIDGQQRLTSLTLRGDHEETIMRKLRIVAAYIDTMIARRVWNWRATDYSTMQYNIFQVVILEIRGKSVPELAEILVDRLNAEEETFASNDRFFLHGMNGRQIHRLLARMIDYVETHSGRASRYAEYIQRGGAKGYEVEHIWADHPEAHADEFAHPYEFADYRNFIGGLLLLPKSFNASYGDLPYSEKLQHYYGQNLLAQSLNAKAYEHDPGFRRFREETGLPFRPHPEFRKADLDARQDLYRRIAEVVWSPDHLLAEVDR